MSANCSGSVSRPCVSTLSWKALPLVVGRLAERAGGDLDVLRAQRGDDLAGGQVERGGAAGIDPDPHRIVARAEQLHVADAVDPGQPVA